VTDATSAPAATDASGTGGERVVVLVAMDDEAAPFLERAEHVGDPRRVGGSVHRSVVVDGLPLLLVKSGIGFVNAAGATTSAVLATGGRAELVVSAGTAGGLGEGVEVGDVVVGSEYLNLDADARVFGYQLGQVPGMPATYHADGRLLEAALSLPLAADAGWHVRAGLLASSYSFMTDHRSLAVRESFPAVAAADMESIAIAQISHVHGVPFLAVRGISDLAGVSAAEVHEENLVPTAERSATVALHVARTLVGP